MKSLFFSQLFEELMKPVPIRMKSEIVFCSNDRYQIVNKKILCFFDDVLVPHYKENEYVLISYFYDALDRVVRNSFLNVSVIRKAELRKETIKRKFEELLLWLLKNQKGIEGYGVAKINFPSNQIEMVYEYFRVNGVELPEELKEVPKKP